MLKQLPQRLSKEEYYRVRDNKDRYKDWFRSAVLLFGFILRASFTVSSYGAETLSKKEGFRNYYQEAINNFKKQIPNLQGINFAQRNYKDISMQSKTLFYCDPPYKKGVGYIKDFNHEEFWDWVRRISEKHIVIVSENEAPTDFDCIWEMNTKSTLNNRKVIQRTEKLFVYKGKI